MRETSVGPETLCAWRYRKGGGNHFAYAANGSKEQNTGMLAAVADGMPINDIIGAIIPDLGQHLKIWAETGEIPVVPQEEINRRVAKIPMKPKTKF